MFKYLVGAAVLAAATAGNAAVAINFNSATGNLGNSHTYSSGGLSVTATGYASNGNQTALFGKNNGGDENGVGLNGYTDNEINGPGTDFIQVDVSNLLLQGASAASFFMNSTTNGEWWAVYGQTSSNGGTLGTLLFSGHDEGAGNLHALTGWGTYQYYDFVALGTCNSDGHQCTAGNVLLGGLSVTPGVPEPATWAMMLLGFAGIGAAVRRKQRASIAQIA